MLTGLLHAAPGVRVRASVSSACEGRALPVHDIDVVLVDLDLGDGDGIDLARELRAEAPTLHVVLLSAADASHRIRALPSSERSAWSYLSKTSALSAASLLQALMSAAEGRPVIDRGLAERRVVLPDSPLDALSGRQLEVLKLLAAGLTNAAIAAELGIAVRSVDNHVNAVYLALGVTATAQTNARVTAASLFLDHTR
ncbi:DNA-binding NarL/FixJ family response regulator [Microbacterium trichothecenolyticum]|uniref:DNA-binding NarL/FixJ family response regulator n=2 Tax=Microbacterium trichothecenolyticum TaxID=69370 RepID=A0ABU0U160_MICTR|nr:DNA-binding NarL/FixJ family response regulator [Microbacterium trichothecenolyticum]